MRLILEARIKKFSALFLSVEKWFKNYIWVFKIGGFRLIPC